MRTAHNADIAALFDRTADLLEIDDANPFRVRAYRLAAQTVAEWSEDAQTLIGRGQDLTSYPHIGADLAGKIKEIASTGHLAVLDDLLRKYPSGLLDLLKIEGLGPRRVAQLFGTLHIKSPEDLRRAAAEGTIQKLPRFSAKVVDKILHALEARGATGARTPWAAAEEIAEPLAAWLREVDGVTRVVVAGSYRRRKDTVGDIDILVTCRAGSPVIRSFIGHDEVRDVLSSGTTRATVVLRNGLQVDLRVVPESSYGAALYYFTGSKSHNIAVRKMAVDKGLKINEYGVFRGQKRIAGRTEEEVFAKVGLPYIEPELRENRGEIRAALEGRLPKLVTLEDIRGDLHVHTNETDGRNSLEEMVEAARGRGYRYIAITDHSRHLTVANGLDEKRLRRQCEKIDRLNGKLRDFTVLKSCEVDILSDGALDLPDSILRELDLTVCSVHYKFDMPEDKQTERILRAMDNPYFTILGHPTGRLMGKREGYKVDMERIMKAAHERGCILEVNGQPDRLDLDDVNCMMARELGVPLSIATDSHNIASFDLMRLGVAQARRGWIEAAQVLNTRTLTLLKKLIRRS